MEAAGTRFPASTSKEHKQLTHSTKQAPFTWIPINEHILQQIRHGVKETTKAGLAAAAATTLNTGQSSTGAVAKAQDVLARCCGMNSAIWGMTFFATQFQKVVTSGLLEDQVSEAKAQTVLDIPCAFNSAEHPIAAVRSFCREPTSESSPQ